MRLMVCSARSPFPDVALRIVGELSLTNAMAFQRDYGMRKGSQPSPLVRREMNGVILVLEVCPLCDGQDAGIVQLAGRTRRCPYRRSRADRRDCVSAWAARKCRSGLRVEPIWTRRSRRRGDGGNERHGIVIRRRHADDDRSRLFMSALMATIAFKPAYAG
jgi:hypothetical protein